MSNIRHDHGLRVIAFAALLLMLGLATASTARATTYTVTSTDDAGPNTLRAAVANANGDPSPPATIVFAPGVTGVIDLLSPLALTHSATIEGPGSSTLELDGNGGNVQILKVSSGATVSVSGLRFAFGAAPDPGGGGPATGGAIANDGTLNVAASQFDHNSAGGPSQVSGPDVGDGEGGAIYNSGSLTVRDSTFTGNASGGAGAAANSSSNGLGGAIFNDSHASLTVTGSTFTGNTAGGGGGAGANSGSGAGGAIAGNTLGSISLTDSTFTANAAGGPAGPGSNSGQGFGGGVIVGYQSTGTLRNDTIDANAVGSASGSDGAGFANVGTASIIGTIVSANTGAPNCTYSINGTAGSISERASLEGPAGQTSCGFDLASADPKLGPLADNGGPTNTQALGAGSPAIGAVFLAGDCPATDQRGALRPQGGCDVGAYEVAPPSVGAASATSTGPTTATLDASVSNPDVIPGTVSFQYGTSTAYGTTSASQTIPATGAPAGYAAALSNLAPGTVYHFRVVATNPDGATFGPDQQFVTASPAAPPSAQSSQPSQPSNVFTFGKAKVGSLGAITLPVNAPDAGRFTAKATFTVIIRKGHKRVKTTFTYGTASVQSTGRGTFKLVIGLRGPAAREFKLLGSRQVTITVTFTPSGGSAAHKAKNVTVKRNRKGKYS
ncbi:MAG: choice-of-anchor Q domain-containing protein [Solirubrobacteraceae bacterium]